MISFIVPFSTIEDEKFLNLNEKDTIWSENDSANIVFSTLKTLKNIESLDCEKEIILVDNSHTWPEVDLPYVKVVKGWQALPLEELKKVDDYMNHKDVEESLSNIGCLTMWVSMAFHCGVKHAKGDYIVLQHNDTFYHDDFINQLVVNLERDELGYISVDNKKVWISTYLFRKRLLDNYIKNPTFLPEDGGYVNTEFGFADAYFFLTRKDFFDNYDIDWNYGDTNHGATIKCLSEGRKFLHLGPYYDNPNFMEYNEDTLHTYFYKDKPFLSHLKGGFSENKMTSKDYESELNRYLTGLLNEQ